MNRYFQILVWIAILWFAGFSLAYGGALLADLENALMCKCDDKCGKVLINCTCDTADKTRKNLQENLDSGLTVEQIVHSYVEKYGETVLSAPTKRGFNLTAWLTPFVAIVGGGLGIRRIIKTWLVSKSVDASDSNAQVLVMAEEKNRYTSQLQKELDNLEI